MLSDILFVLLLATLFSALLTGPAGWRHPRSSSATGAVMFLLLLLAIGMLASAARNGPHPWHGLSPRGADSGKK